MTAKEQAEELINAMTLQKNNSFRYRVAAKEHSLIAVNMIINYMDENWDNINWNEKQSEAYVFWGDVREEILNL